MIQADKHLPLTLLWVILSSMAVFLVGCEDNEKRIRVPARELYHQAVLSAENEFFTKAEEKLKALITENPGTHLSTLAHLKLAEIAFKREQWDEAETHYRLFLSLNSQHHLTPYVLSQLIALNYQRNLQGLFFRSRDYDRDMAPNRKILQDYGRFFLLYRQSLYLGEVHDYLFKARADLAEHEFLVGNFYFRQKAYDSAISRYMTLLKNYPEYPKTRKVCDQLIRAYQANQQPQLALEMQKVLESRFLQQPPNNR